MGVENHVWTSDGFEAGLQATRNVLSGNAGELALVCATDVIAMGALHALHNAGASLAVTGFDDIPAAAQFIPPITTMRQPIREMAKRAFDAVVAPSEAGEVLLKGKLVVRSSS